MSELGDALRQLPLPASSPAQERAVMAARGAFAPPDSSKPWLPRSRRVRVALAGVAVAALLATPPGQAAVRWAADVVGVGEVGGPPTLEEDSQTTPPSGEAIVFQTGTAPGGERFEIVAYRSNDVHLPGVDPNTEGQLEPAICVRTRFPEAPTNGGDGFCYGGAPTEDGVRLGSLSVLDQGSGAAAFATLEGEANDRTRSVEVSYRDDAGEAHQVSASVAVLGGPLGERIGVIHPTAYFVAFLPGVSDLARISSYEISAVGYDADGNQVGSDQLANSAPEVAARTPPTGGN
jgi:hypothetical protein